MAYLGLIDALKELPHKQRVAIVLHHLVDLPVEQVATETGASVSAVKKQLARGRSTLNVLLNDDDPVSSTHAPRTVRRARP